MKRTAPLRKIVARKDIYYCEYEGDDGVLGMVLCELSCGHTRAYGSRRGVPKRSARCPECPPEIGGMINDGKGR